MTTPDITAVFPPRAAEAGPVAGNERLYRRIPPTWYQPGKTKKIPQRAFMPRPWKSHDEPGDSDGLSVARAHLTTIAAASIVPRTGRKAHVCELGVAAVHRLGLTVVSKPLPSDPSHGVIPELNSLSLRDENRAASVEEWAIGLRDSAVLVYEANDAG